MTLATSAVIYVLVDDDVAVSAPIDNALRNVGIMLATVDDIRDLIDELLAVDSQTINDYLDSDLATTRDEAYRDIALFQGLPYPAL